MLFTMDRQKCTLATMGSDFAYQRKEGKRKRSLAFLFLTHRGEGRGGKKKLITYCITGQLYLALAEEKERVRSADITDRVYLVQ